MPLAQPLWLLLLIPWIAAVFWLLRATPRNQEISFSPLWDVRESSAARRAHRVPPLAICVALAASLMGIVAAAGPHMPGKNTKPRSITVIVDRGISMSTRPIGGDWQFVTVAKTLAPLLSESLLNSRVSLRTIPPSPVDSLIELSRWEPTAVDTSLALRVAVQSALHESDGPVIVISNQPLLITSDRLIEASPATRLNNVGIEKLVVRIGNPSQAMARIANHSPLRTASLTITAGNKGSTRLIDLPPSGSSQNVFIDLPAEANSVHVSLQSSDDLAPNHDAWATRQNAWPKLQARAALSPDVERFIAVYSRLRPSTSDSRTIAVADSPIDTDDPQLIVAAGQIAIVSPSPKIILQNREMNLSDLNWQQDLAGASLAALPHKGNWTRLVLLDGQPIVAIDSAKPRQFWIGFSADAFSHSADFVKLLSRAVDWLNSSGEPAFISEIAGDAPDSQTPGLHGTRSDAVRAINAAAMPAVLATPSSDWQPRLRTLLASNTQDAASLTPALACAIAGLIALCALFWRAENHTSKQMKT